MSPNPVQFVPKSGTKLYMGHRYFGLHLQHD
jgi:hypothetical protein